MRNRFPMFRFSLALCASLYLTPAGATDRSLSDEELREIGPPALELSDVPKMQHIMDEYVRDKDWAILLGKALFWEQAVGSDGVACASCHFHAGADSRSKNQLNPGFLNKDPGIDPLMFDILASGGGGANYQLKPQDFPFNRQINDIVSSQGARNSDFVSILLSKDEDTCTPEKGVFSLYDLAHRNVEPRNTPTVINAVFNHRNFWDGRANNLFNGIDPLGLRSNVNNPAQGVWVYDSYTRSAKKKQVAIKNSSLASQAVGPPLSDLEMSCGDRTFPLIGKKILTRRALAYQKVHPDDSVLGQYRHDSGNGLIFSYSQLVRKAFYDKYWRARGKVDGEFTQMEANFSLLWGLAIQMYEATLVSHQTRYDDFARGDNKALTEQEKLGLELFSGRGKCLNCHGGPEFTTATVRARALPTPSGEPMERMIMGNNKPAVYDGGFYNIGVTKSNWDLCVGDDLAGFPLSFSKQASTGNIVDKEASADAIGDAADGTETGPVKIGERVAVNGACKVPTIRNVELTAPFFHNGGHHTLEQVVRAYAAGFRHLFAFDNIDDLDPDILEIDLRRGEGEVEAIVAFMKALTDKRVVYHKAPFDHPELTISNGGTNKDDNSDGFADDEIMVIPAVGKSGLSKPLPNFLD